MWKTVRPEAEGALRADGSVVRWAGDVNYDARPAFAGTSRVSSASFAAAAGAAVRR